MIALQWVMKYSIVYIIFDTKDIRNDKDKWVTKDIRDTKHKGIAEDKRDIEELR